jgi:CRISPR/Cas system endoribonuclease Cas6 (RAMP superfamily)
MRALLPWGPWQLVYTPGPRLMVNLVSHSIFDTFETRLGLNCAHLNWIWDSFEIKTNTKFLCHKCVTNISQMSEILRQQWVSNQIQMNLLETIESQYSVSGESQMETNGMRVQGTKTIWFYAIFTDRNARSKIIETITRRNSGYLALLLSLIEVRISYTKHAQLFNIELRYFIRTFYENTRKYLLVDSG